MAKTKIKKKPQTVENTLEHRTREYQRHTTEMFQQMHKITDVLEGKIKAEPTFRDGTIVWQDITQQEGLEGAIFLHLSIEFPIGTIVTTPSGVEVTITEETADYFNKGVVIGISMDVTRLTKKKDIKKALAVSSQDQADNLERLTEGTDIPSSTTNTAGELSEDDAKRLLLSARNPSGVKH